MTRQVELFLKLYRRSEDLISIYKFFNNDVDTDSIVYIYCSETKWGHFCVY